MKSIAREDDLLEPLAFELSSSDAPGAAGAHETDLSTMPTGATERRVALAVVVLSVLTFAAAAPFARVPLARISAFIPAYEAALAINDLITAVLLFGQFTQLRSRALLALASGYLFDALIMVPHALSYPGVFADAGLLGAGPQTTAWLYMFWHGGFPLFVVAYALLDGRIDTSAGAGRAVSFAVLLVGPLVAALTLVATVGHDALPGIMVGSDYAPAITPVVACVWGLSLVAMLAVWRKPRRSVLDLWLMVVMCAWLFDVALSAVLNAGRFDLGFYTGRLYGLLAASFVLGALLLETNGLHARLARAQARLTSHARELEARVRARTAELARSNDTLKAEIAERRQAEAQLRQAQKMEAVGTLTGGMAHDFNNLLGVVIGNLDMLRGFVKGNATVDELAGEALDAALRGADLTRRLLAFARRQPLQPARIDVNELVDGITKLLSRTLGERIEIEVRLAPDLWPVVADPAQLESALTNLATNARDAMPNGGRLIIATGRRTLDADYALLHPEVVPGEFAMIEVSDTGTGMPADVLSRIFEPFFTTKEQGQGTGLGLSMVFGFIKQSGGHISVYSEPAVGTTFRLYLPRTADVGETATRAVVEETPLGRGDVVLAVEDNAPLRRIVVRQLHELGYRALEAENAAAALVVLEHEHVDLLFSDVVMPGELSGIELARAAVARRPHIKVVLTSGFPGTKIAGSLGEAATARLLSKPYRKTDLARALRAVLGE
jgi:signal transduction histidine kinase/CheY-like chemotaxis protein